MVTNAVCRIVQKYLDSDDEGKRLMTLQYGENVLRKLLESYEQDQNNQFACEKYIRENTVLPAHLSTQRLTGG